MSIGVVQTSNSKRIWQTSWTILTSTTTLRYLLTTSLALHLPRIQRHKPAAKKKKTVRLSDCGAQIHVLTETADKLILMREDGVSVAHSYADFKQEINRLITFCTMNYIAVLKVSRQ